MTLSDAAYARLHADLDRANGDLSAKWLEVAPTLDKTDEASRDAWIEARQAFFDDEGVIPPPRADRDRMGALKDKYKGERCFVIGNGPSLNLTALHELEGEFTFGVNRIYMMFDRISWRPTFYTTLDWRVAPDCLDDINGLDDMTFFFPERFRGMLRGGDDVYWYANAAALHPSEQGFASDASLGIRGAGSVSGAAIQLAFHMGFDPIHVIGCDVTYSIPETVEQEGPDQFGNGVGLFLTSTEDDDGNHFDKRYFGAGKRWHDPNVKRMFQGFEQCANGVAKHGREIFNAGVGGNLETFERVSFRSLFPPTAPRPEPSLAGLMVAAAGGFDIEGVVDIGAGRGAHLASFAAAGATVRAFEPSADQRAALVASLPVSWEVFVDPRAIDVTEGPRPAYDERNRGGVVLAPPSDGAAEVDGGVYAVDIERGLEPARDMRVDVLVVDANDWESEVLSAWPFHTHRPEFVIVGLDDSRSPRFGFDRGSIAAQLTELGYEVSSIVADRWSTGTDMPVGGGLVTLIGAAAGRIDASLAATVSNVRAAVAAPSEGAVGAPLTANSDPKIAAELRVAARELARLQSSTSWKIGSAIVQTIAPIKGPLRRMRRLLRGVVRRLRSR